MKRLLALFALTCAVLCAGTLFSGSYPNVILVIDEAQGKVVDTIKLETGLPTNIRMSHDKKLLYVFTNDHSGFEVVDIASRKVLSHFVLNDSTHKYRTQGGAPDPQGKFLYATTTKYSKLIDRYEIGKAQYSIIDIAQQKIVKSVDQPTEPSPGEAGAAGAAGGGGGGGGGRGGGFEVSPDGKYLYQFGANVKVLKAEDFSEVETIPLGLPDSPNAEGLAIAGTQDGLGQADQRVSLFTYSDPFVHNKVFGLATFDLNKRKFDFKPIGPAPMAMTYLRVAPDMKEAYSVIVNGTGGNRRCEFWAIDVPTTKLARTAEVPCRSRFSFGMSADGKKLYMYGAGYEIEVYDAKTLKLETIWDLGHDMTMSGLVTLP